MNNVDTAASTTQAQLRKAPLELARREDDTALADRRRVSPVRVDRLLQAS